MSRLLSIFRFSWPYVQAYRWRLFGAILAGVIFGISNAGVLALTEMVLDRLNTPESADLKSGETLASEGGNAQPPTLAPPRQESNDSAFYSYLDQFAPEFSVRLRNLQSSAEKQIQEWLDWLFPRMGIPVTLAQALGAILGLPLLVSIRSAGQYLSAYWMSWVGERMVNDLRVEVLDRLSQLSLGYFNQAKIGDMITRINGDTVMLQYCISHGIKHSVTDPVTIIAVFIYLLVSDWQLTLIVLFLLPVCLLPVFVYGRKARRASKKKVKTNVIQASLIVELLSAIRVVKAFSLEDREVGRFRRLSRELFSQTMKGIRAHEIVGPIIETTSTIAFGALIVFVVQTQRSVTDLVVFFAGIVIFYMPVKKLAKLHVLFEQTSVGVERLQKVLAEVPEVREREDAKSVQGFDSEIRFQNVSFAYGDDAVLKNLDLTIPRGRRLGIAGESGSGKSTLINLLFRFFDPQSGSLLIDGTPLTELRIRDYRQLLALVSQDVVVFDQTVSENIASGRLGASSDAVYRAAQQAHAVEFIEGLEAGFETRLGERGVTLSGGQRQRIAIARAFVRDAPILVLDEATAALDAKSEGEVQSAIDDLAANRTVICIAHRLSTLQAMDEIIVLEKGRIVEQGSYSALLNQGGIFAQMAARQGINSGDSSVA